MVKEYYRTRGQASVMFQGLLLSVWSGSDFMFPSFIYTLGCITSRVPTSRRFRGRLQVQSERVHTEFGMTRLTVTSWIRIVIKHLNFTSLSSFPFISISKVRTQIFERRAGRKGERKRSKKKG